MRLTLASSVSAIVVVDAWMTGLRSAPVEVLLAAYVLCSVILYLLARHHSSQLGGIAAWEHWIDAGVFSTLSVMDSQRGGLFFCGLFLPFLIASFRWGFLSAIRVTLVSALVYVAPGVMSQVRTRELDLDHLLVPPATLLVLGTMVSRLGGFEIMLKRRLGFIGEITGITNPRFGAENATHSFLERLRAFYRANACVLVLADLDGSGVRLRRAVRSDSGKAFRDDPIPSDLAALLLSLPSDAAVVRRTGADAWGFRRPYYFEYDVVRGRSTAEAREQSERLAATLDAESLLTVPIRYRHQTLGRIYVASARPDFEESDVHFLMQVFEHFMPVIDNIRLVDGIATDAGTAERKRIARDLHDSVIQPYIGLKLGIGSLKSKLASGTLRPDDMDRLIDISEEAIADLRRYVAQLKGRAEHDGDLVGAVRRFAGKFSYATGISVEIVAAEDLTVNDRLSAEAIQIVSEGLSNIRRHTESMRARVCLACDENQLMLRIANTGNGHAPEPFVPRSITERAEALGGRSNVELSANGESTVVVEIPL